MPVPVLRVRVEDTFGQSGPAAELLLRGAVYAGVYGLAACVSGTAELCVPESLRPARRAEKARALR